MRLKYLDSRPTSFRALFAAYSVAVVVLSFSLGLIAGILLCGG